MSAMGLEHKSCLVKCGEIFVLAYPFVHKDFHVLITNRSK